MQTISRFVRNHGSRRHSRSSASSQASSLGLFRRRIVRELEMSVLSKVPGYEYMKHAGASMLGVDETAEYLVVLANLGGAWRIGVQTDELSENLVAVFVPNSPNPLSGGAFLIAAGRLRPAGSPSPLRWGLSDASAPDREHCSANSQRSGQHSRISRRWIQLR
jgi:hypothetical protein